MTHSPASDQRVEIERLRGALQLIADETICPEAFPTLDGDDLAYASALLIARAALEGGSYGK